MCAGGETISRESEKRTRWMERNNSWKRGRMKKTLMKNTCGSTHSGTDSIVFRHLRCSGDAPRGATVSIAYATLPYSLLLPPTLSCYLSPFERSRRRHVGHIIYPSTYAYARRATLAIYSPAVLYYATATKCPCCYRVKFKFVTRPHFS